MSDTPASSLLAALSTELAGLIRDVAPSLVSIQSGRARSTGFSRAGLYKNRLSHQKPSFRTEKRDC